MENKEFTPEQIANWRTFLLSTELYAIVPFLEDKDIVKVAQRFQEAINGTIHPVHAQVLKKILKPIASSEENYKENASPKGFCTLGEALKSKE